MAFNLTRNLKIPVKIFRIYFIDLFKNRIFKCKYLLSIKCFIRIFKAVNLIDFHRFEKYFLNLETLIIHISQIKNIKILVLYSQMLYNVKKNVSDIKDIVFNMRHNGVKKGHIVSIFTQ